MNVPAWEKITLKILIGGGGATQSGLEHFLCRSVVPTSNLQTGGRGYRSFLPQGKKIEMRVLETNFSLSLCAEESFRAEHGGNGGFTGLSVERQKKGKKNQPSQEEIMSTE